MKLPHVDHAVVPEAKVVNYLLNAAHPDGRGKAANFAAMGFTVEDWPVLAKALRELARTSPVARTVESVHGTKYIVDGELAGPLGQVAEVRTVWIVDAGGEVPRRVTAYPLAGGIRP